VLALVASVNFEYLGFHSTCMFYGVYAFSVCVCETLMTLFLEFFL